MQGHLRGSLISAEVKTECAHCGMPIHVNMDSDLNFVVEEEGADPLVFIPMVDFSRLKDPSIINVF